MTSAKNCVCCIAPTGRAGTDKSREYEGKCARVHWVRRGDGGCSLSFIFFLCLSIAFTFVYDDRLCTTRTIKKRIGSLNTEFSQITAQNTHISKKHDPTWKLNITELVNQWFKICDKNSLSTILTLNHRTTLIQHRWFIAPARKKRKTPFPSDSRQLYSREKIDTVFFICLPSNVLEIFSLARKIYSLNNLAVSRCLKNTHQKLLWKYANHSDFKSQNYSASPSYFQYWIDCSRCNSTKHLIS